MKVVLLIALVLAGYLGYFTLDSFEPMSCPETAVCHYHQYANPISGWYFIISKAF